MPNPPYIPPTPPPKEPSKRKPFSIRIILKSGSEFTVQCDAFTLWKNEQGAVTRWEAEGCAQNMPLYLDFGEVAAVLQANVPDA